jgi:hypothetical protein
MATLYAPYNPTGATRTSKYGVLRPIPLEPDWHNHMWFERFEMDFVNKNLSKNDGMISGGTVTGDGIDTTTVIGGVAYINGQKVTIATPGAHVHADDGWEIIYATNVGDVIFGPLDNSNVQSAVTSDNAVVIGYSVKGDGVFNVYSFANVIKDALIDGLTDHIQPNIVVGPSLSNDRVTDLETTFIASLSAGDQLLFIDAVVFTAARTITDQVKIWMDGPAIKVDIDTFDFTLNDCSGYIGITSSGGKLILNGHCRGLIVDGNVNIEKGSGFSGNYFTTGMLSGQNADHKWGTSAQVTAGTATFYTDGSGNPLDKDAATVVINDDEKILIAHDIAAIANHALDCGGKKVTIEMLAGVTWDLDTFDLALGGVGDSIGGDIRITQTGDLSIIGNRGLMINNSRDVYEDFKTKNLIIDVFDNITVKATAGNIIFIDKFGGGKRVNDISLSWDSTTTTGDIVGGQPVKNSHWYGCAVDSERNVKLLPILEGVADADVLNSLSASGATFQTDETHVDDEIFNLDTGLKGFIKAISSETVVTIKDKIGIGSVDFDLFPDGDERYLIHMKSPTGLGDSWNQVGRVLTNSSGLFVDSTYEHIQETKYYFGDTAGLLDFSISGTPSITVLNQATAAVKQELDWTGKGRWKTGIYIDYDVAQVARTSASFTMTGVDFLQNQPITYTIGGGDEPGRATASGDTINADHISQSTLKYGFIQDLICNKKPDFHN